MFNFVYISTDKYMFPTVDLSGVPIKYIDCYDCT